MSTAAIVKYESLVSVAQAATRPTETVERGSPWGPLVAFLLGFGARLQVQVIGYLPLSEIALILAFPFLASNYLNPVVRRRSGWLVPLLFLWLGGAIISDLYRQTEWTLAARGLGRLVVYLTAVPFFAWFLATDMYRKLTYFAAGIVPSSILSAYVLRGGVHEGRELVYGKAVISWRTHWAFVVWLLGLFLILYLYRRSRTAAYVSAFLVGAVNVLGGARSTGALGMLAIPACIAKNWFLQPQLSRRQRPRLASTVLVGLLLVATAYGVFELYSYLARSGMLGDLERDRYFLESKSESDVLTSGRLVHIAGGLIAVSESPLIGYGSWPLDRQGFFLRACEYYGIKSVFYDYYSRGYPLIPSHSHIVAAMVEHGMAAGVFWVYAIFVAIRAVLWPLSDSRRLELWVMTTATAMIWNVLFSPISYRMESSMMLVAFIIQHLGWTQPHTASLLGRHTLAGGLGSASTLRRV